LLLFASALIVAAAVVWAALHVASVLRIARAPQVALVDLMTLFAPGITAVVDDPKALLAWYPLAATARRLYPSEFAAIDRSHGSTFPFSIDQLQAAHSRWTADWLTWERAHDGDYKLKAVLLAHELGDRATSVEGRARLNAIENEKLDRYQRRYEEYTRVARALQALLPK
jgi:hypothetical protein